MPAKRSKFAYLNKSNEVVFCEQVKRSLLIAYLPISSAYTDVHRFQEVSTDLKKFDVLVKVLACGISIAAEEYKPVVDESEINTKYKTLGTDISGIVQSVGAEVKTLHVGDHVAGLSLENYISYSVIKNPSELPATSFTGVIPVSSTQSGCGQYVVVEEYDLGLSWLIRYYISTSCTLTSNHFFSCSSHTRMH